MFSHFKIHLLTGIIVNYLICFLCGVVFLQVQSPWSYMGSAWLPYALGLGFFFIAGFNFVGSTVALYGISLATLMQKMSLAISVVFAIVYFNEPLSMIKLMGLILGLLSILLYNNKVWKEKHKYKGLIMIPILAWLVSGVIEIGLLYSQKNKLIAGEDAAFVSIIFLTAGLMGMLFALTQKGALSQFNKRNISGGILLGVPNFFSMYFLVKLLGTDWPSSVALSVNNIGILVCSASIGLFFFGEKNNLLQWAGLVLSLISIFILSWWS